MHISKTARPRRRMDSEEEAMADDLKKMYKTVMDDHFPMEITISFGDQVLDRKSVV